MNLSILQNSSVLTDLFKIKFNMRFLLEDLESLREVI